MNEEEFFNRIINKIAKDYGYDVASTLELMFFKKDKQLEAYENMRKEAIKWINKHKEKLHHNFDEPDWEYLLYGSADELLNILNKVGDSDDK